MSELFSALGSLGADDVHAMSEPALLVRTEMLLAARDMLDGEIARSLQAADVREVTVNECGRTTRPLRPPSPRARSTMIMPK